MIDTMISVEKMKNGETVKLSAAQIVFTLVNMSEAKKNLTPGEFESVYEVFNIYMKDTEKIEMDMYMYVDMCKIIINSFDVYAPFEKYSGRDKDDIEFLIFLQEIREEAEEIRSSDENYVLVKKAMEDNKNEVRKIIMEESLESDNNVSEKSEKIAKKFSDLMCDYVINNLDDNRKDKFVDLINDSDELYKLTSYDKSFFDRCGFHAGVILSFLYYIDGLEENIEKCSVLSKMQREIFSKEMKLLVTLEKLKQLNPSTRQSYSNTGCGFVIIFAITSILAFGISFVI